VIAVAALVASGAARAGDGRVEISQSRALAGNVTPGDTPGFPVDLFTPGSYVLTSDLVVPNATTGGIVVWTPGSVTIDLAGFALRGPVTCTGYGSTLSCTSGFGIGINGASAVSEPAPLIVKNGRIEGFRGDAVTTKGECLLSDLELRFTAGLALGLALGPGLEGLPCIVRNVTIALSPATETAMALYGSMLVADSIVDGTLSSAAIAENGPISFLRNSIRRNGLDGIHARDPVLLIDNAVDANERMGVAISYLPMTTWPSLLIGNSLYENAPAGGGWAQLHFGGCATGTGYTNNVITPPLGGITVANCDTADLYPNLCNGVPNCP
jgi:hypothetical protein